MMDALNALADRIEAQSCFDTGPLEDLCRLIHGALPDGRRPANGSVRPYAFSQDAAAELTFGADYSVTRENGRARACVGWPLYDGAAAGFAATPALALCAAALRARAAQGTEARSGETERLDPKGDGPVAKPCA